LSAAFPNYRAWIRETARVLSSAAAAVLARCEAKKNMTAGKKWRASLTVSIRATSVWREKKLLMRQLAPYGPAPS